jgi:membrane protein DedA with SNARE-associated domain
MNHLLNQIILLLDNPLALFLIMFGLSVANLFFPPIPLESATLVAGYLSGAGYGSLIVIVGSTVSGMFTGSLILFFLAKRYGESLFYKTPIKKIITEKSYHRAGKWFQKYGWWAIFIGKVIPGMSFYTIVFAGILRWESKRAATAFLASNLFFFMALALAGRALGSNWGKVIVWLGRLNKIALVIIGFLLVGGLIFYLVRRKTKT